ncbi:MAG TPA: DoxX family protein [Planctomycetaceae bacterium]|nr:DoxX family protein [Planctomycetaceae bacterium]
MSSPPAPPVPSRGRTIAYWLATLLVVFVFAYGGVLDLMRPPQVVEIMTRLGYPVYLCAILGAWKLLGVIALLLPRTPRLKEWAYAGIFFDLTGAAASHFAVQDSVTDIATPIVIVVIAAASWALRPASRRLAGRHF